MIIVVFAFCMCVSCCKKNDHAAFFFFSVSSCEENNMVLGLLVEGDACIQPTNALPHLFPGAVPHFCRSERNTQVEERVYSVNIQFLLHFLLCR